MVNQYQLHRKTTRPSGARIRPPIKNIDDKFIKNKINIKTPNKPIPYIYGNAVFQRDLVILRTKFQSVIILRGYEKYYLAF